MIRGILVTNPNYGLGGLYGIVPSQADTTGIERVEVFRGPSAFLNGALPSAVGGTINLVPKRATNEPITQVSALYLSDAQLGGTVDIGRRFGPDQSVGLRANATYTSGDTAVNNQTAERLALTLGLRLPQRCDQDRRRHRLPAARRRRLPGQHLPGGRRAAPGAALCQQELLSAMGAPAGRRPVRRAALRARHHAVAHRLPQGRRQARQHLDALPQPEHRELQRQHHDAVGRAVPAEHRGAVRRNRPARHLQHRPDQARGGPGRRLHEDADLVAEQSAGDPDQLQHLQSDVHPGAQPVRIAAKRTARVRPDPVEHRPGRRAFRCRGSHSAHRRRARATPAECELQRGDRPAHQRQRQERGFAVGLVRREAGQGIHVLRQLHPGPAAGSDRGRWDDQCRPDLCAVPHHAVRARRQGRLRNAGAPR